MKHTLDLFPSLISHEILSEDIITPTIMGKIEHIKKNKMDKYPFSQSTWSGEKLRNVLDLSKFEDLKKYILEETIFPMKDQYECQNLSLGDSYLINVEKGGFFLPQKTFDSSFLVLLNLSEHTDIFLMNPSTFSRSRSLAVHNNNKYNSQYVSLPFEKNSTLALPSQVQFGFQNPEEDVTFVCITIY